MVLIVVSSMAIVSVGLAYRTRIELKLARTNAQRVQAYYLALAGVARSKALLSKQELSPATIAGICRFAGTANEEGLFEQLGQEGLTDRKFLGYSVRDEQSYLNINNSDPAIWENMGSISSEYRAAIIDWVDADDDTSPDGAETDFYLRLEPPYVSKNKPCLALRELLFLKEVTFRVYTGEDLNRNSLLDENEKDGSLSFPPDNEDNKLDSGLVDIFTVYGDGRANINTTSKAVLSALPGLDESAADTILAYRAGPDGQPGTDDDAYMASAEDLGKVEGLTEMQIELLQQYCCFESRHFRIFSYAKVDESCECCLMATVSCEEGGLRLLCLERLL